MNDKLIALLVSSLGPASAGCYPRYTLVQPALTLTVRDSSGQEVSDATVYFVAGSNPHHMLHHKNTYVTDADGIVQLESRHEWELVAPIVPHGVRFYYFAWCVEKDGYQPIRGYLSATDVWCSHEETITLDRGQSDGECGVAYEQVRHRREPEPTATAGALPAERLRQ